MFFGGSMIIEGLVIMIQGIGTVFLFLALMVWASKQSSFIVLLYLEKKAAASGSAGHQGHSVLDFF
jgi:Na+-transporting methylmalonyl-CoA/oxaloacetate decarboxylase gamma subunit